MILYKWKKSLGGVHVSPSTKLHNQGTDIGVVEKDAQECEDNKSYIICDNMSTKTTIFDKNFGKYEKNVTKWGTLSALEGSLINLLISDKAQKMARDVPLTNIYNMSTNNWTPNKYLTNTVGELNKEKHTQGEVDVSLSFYIGLRKTSPK